MKDIAITFVIAVIANIVAIIIYERYVRKT